MLITLGVIAVNGDIDAFVNIPLNAAPLATFATRTTLFGVGQVDTVLPLANGQQSTVSNQVAAVSNSLSGTLLGQEFTFTVCPCPTGGTVFFDIPVSAGVTELPEPHSFVLVLLGVGLMLWARKFRRC